MKKNNKTKWNRKHEFQIKKGTKSTKPHPAYVYAQSGNKYKHLIFTHSPTTNGKANVPLKYNIDPNEKRTGYIRPMFFVDRRENFEPPKKKYRIHPDDMSTIKKYKK